jgi:threonine aldolase
VLNPLEADEVTKEIVLGDEVKLFGDGLSPSPEEHSRILAALTAGGRTEADYYSKGGAVDAMEKAFAQTLGKERAVFFPTGTLANHVAIRILAGEKTRALVQEKSHIYNDSGDCVQVLSQLDLVPLGHGQSSFGLDEVQAEVKRAERGRVRTGVGVISIESPVRRKLGEVFPLEVMREISSWARERDIRLHMDGARLFLASAYSGIPVTEYASLFDTVYVSLWKCFSAPFGAVLAGPTEILEEVFHLRRMMGGGLPYAWIPAVISHHYLDGFERRFQLGREAFDEILEELESSGRFAVKRYANGTNVCRLSWEGPPEPNELRARLRSFGVVLGKPSEYFRGFFLAANETVARKDPREVAQLFLEAV